MFNLNELYFQKFFEKLNNSINSSFNALIQDNIVLGRLLAFFVILSKCLLHTLAILINSLEYAVRGFISLFSSQSSAKEYFSTLASFLVINTINAATLIPDILIRTYFVIKEGKIDQHQTQHTLYYKIMSFI
jgi:hypothetical protein